MNSSLVSIIVPIYGVEEYLSVCIKSLIVQTYKNIEIILVDDGSKDMSSKICDDFAVKDKRIVVIHKENGGLVSARKSGLKVAKGKYIAFVDGDDWVSIDYINNLYTAALKYDAELVVSGHIREFFGKTLTILPRIESGHYNEEEIVNKILPIAIYNNNFFQHGISTYVWNKLFLKDKLNPFLEKINNNIVMGEDAALTYTYLFETKSLAIITATDYFYRQRPNSIVKSVPKIEKEYLQLSLLFQHLKNNINLNKYIYVNNQLRIYFLTQMIIRSGGIINTPNQLEISLPFLNISNNSRIIVYSSGSFGQHLISSLQKTNKYNVVRWIDEDHIESQIFGLEVFPIESLNEIDYDIILIASIDLQFSHSVANRLKYFGVSQDKISFFNPNIELIEKQIKSIGFDLDSFTYLN